MSAHSAATSRTPGRTRPRISVNKLAEYLAPNTPARRREIIRDQANPPVIKTGRYDAARAAIVGYFARGRSLDDLKASLGRLAGWRPGPSDGRLAIDSNRDCRAALESFLRLIGDSGLAELAGGDLTFRAGPQSAPRLVKAGVAISVRPEIVIRGTDGKRGPFVGALKINACKRFRMDKDAAEYAGTLLREFGETHLAGEVACDYRRCYVLDVFAGRLYPAPRATVRRQAEIFAACEEIAKGWPAE